ncbi:hypothetical protein M3Y99_00554400 [Aphelenchoides fujianensis]|nr:hypothetical protein M3Y99_00554400 [Aphelenchoides fujianensis]
MLSVGDQTYRPAEVQVEWKKLRDVFNRTLKKAANGNTGEICWRTKPQDLGKETAPTAAVDLYGLRGLLGRMADGGDSASSTGGAEDDEEDTNRTFNLEWIAAQCAANSDGQKEHESTDGDSVRERATAKRRATTSRRAPAIGVPLRRPPRNAAVSTRNRGRPPTRRPTKQAEETDTFDAFGAYVAAQLRSTSQRDRFKAIKFKREIIELCFKYELETC